MNDADYQFITRGNANAQALIAQFVSLCHTLDDIQDKNEPVTDERMIGELHQFLHMMMVNPWAAQYQVPLMALITVSFNAWLDSNKWESGTDIQKRDVDVLKGMYHEFVWYIAFLCGGWYHMREVTKKYRAYDHDSTKEVV